MIAVANLDSRQKDRDASAFPIEVSGFDGSGRYFTERTVIANANESKCSFQVRAQVPRDSVVAICFIRRSSRPRNARPELFEVVHAGPVANGWFVEATRLLPDSVVSIKTPDRTNRSKRTH
jgi:hypothetical protein